jgi:hypothetical protein
MHRLEAIARDMLGDAGAAQCPIERALDLAGLDRMLFPSLSTRRLDGLSTMPGPKPSLSSGRPRERRSNTAFVRCGGARLSHKLRI